MPVPIYVFTGFLESGKTTLIKETLSSEGFFEGEKTVLLQCEEGSVELEDSFCKQYNTYIVNVEKKEQLSLKLFEKIENFYHPDRIFIEYNGMWNVTELLNTPLPDIWVFAQIISTLDASTFMMYVNNMRSVIYEQLLHSELIICNRCDDSIKKSFLRGNIKAINKSAQIIYEGKDGNAEEFGEEDLPFDLNSDVIEIRDDDYGLWYMDMLDHPRKYHGKTLKVKGEVVKSSQTGKNAFILGRYAMVCCADDTSLVGVLCETSKASELPEKEWIVVEAQVHVDFDPEYGGDIGVLIAKNIERCEPLEDPLVYFN